ncbi:FKBP-type peptidyl-prolyl cis-trans isomerase [Pedobacter heparinus]|uniref:FKBP-type peptidyl-prolyl cis-trans isomerase n=1 Tax=Pedobacter heparinus TaxID=984 RepID=UPI00292EADFD|nr:FKBP-type peptidyl-prolyl cis-trans isomerase [Pedobacter heparinus]
MRIVYILLVFVMFQGCVKQSCFQKGQGGMWYIIHDDKSGDTINVGDYTKLSMIQKRHDGRVVYNSNDYDNRPIVKFREESAFRGDFFTGLGLLSEGDSATIKVSLDSIGKVKGTHVNTGKFLEYSVKIHKVIHRGNLNDSLFNKAINDFYLKEAELAKAQEPAKISRYLKINNLKPEQSSSGLMYLIREKGIGKPASREDTVEVNATLRCFSGKVFDTNLAENAKQGGIFNQLLPYKPMKYPLSMLNPTSGFYEALITFPKGTKVLLIVPSKLAYGANPFRELQPYTPLLCDIEILDIIHLKTR